jgi:Raf kinase inhibitor-like YbhB/YbcL family protein
MFTILRPFLIASLVGATVASTAPVPINLTSPVFQNGKPIAKLYSGEGKDASPPLRWEKVPSATRELALICDDPDSPTRVPWVHWVMYRITPQTKRLPESVPATGTLSGELSGVRQGFNSWNELGYKGPMPPLGHGWHHYRFTLYALDAPIKIQEPVHGDELAAAMKGHIIGEGKLVGTYRRN